MKSKIYLLTAAGTMFVAFTYMQNQLKPRVPASTHLPLSASPQLQPAIIDNVAQIYDYTIKNEVEMQKNSQMLSGMLAQAKQDFANAKSQNPQVGMYPGDPYVANIMKLESSLQTVKIKRQDALNLAIINIFGNCSNVYGQQTNSCFAKVQHLVSIKQYLQFEGTGYYAYPTLENPYLMASVMPAPILQPAVPQQTTALPKKPQQPYGPPAPPEKEQSRAEGMIEPQPEDPTSAVL